MNLQKIYEAAEAGGWTWIGTDGLIEFRRMREGRLVEQVLFLYIDDTARFEEVALHTGRKITVTPRPTIEMVVEALS